MSDHRNELNRIRQIYTSQYSAIHRNLHDPWHPLNPVSLYYRQSQERAINEVITRNALPMEELKILDVGCGAGNLLRYLNYAGASPTALYGIDLIDERLHVALQKGPATAGLQVADAAHLPYQRAYFDLVCQFTVFSSIFDHELRVEVAAEMVRVLKSGGWILWYDLKRGKNQTVEGIDLAEIRLLFTNCRIVHIKPLHPIFASRIAPISQFLCEILERIPAFPKSHYLIALTAP